MAPHRLLPHDRATPGLSGQWPDRAKVVVEYSTELVATENDYHSRRVIAIKVCDDPWFHLSRDEVWEAVSNWLGIHHRDIDVQFYPTKGFLVLLPTSSMHDRELSPNFGLTIGQPKIQLRP
jgi:hypothetical protein